MTDHDTERDPTTLTGCPDAQPDDRPDDAAGGFQCDICGEVFWHTDSPTDKISTTYDFCRHVFGHDTTAGDTPGQHCIHIDTDDAEDAND